MNNLNYDNKRQEELALKALKDKDAMDALKLSLNPLVKNIIEKYQNKKSEINLLKKLYKLVLVCFT